MRFSIGLILFFVSGAAFGQSDITVVDESNNYAAPVLLIQPRVPRDVSDEAFPAKLRVKGTVTAKGIFELASFEPATGMEPFVEAIKDVLEFWRFKPYVTADCVPQESQAIVDVWFEVVDGRRTISVSLPKPKVQVPQKSATPIKRRSIVVQPQKAEYPLEARRRGFDGSAELILQINAAGKVLSREVLTSTPWESFGQAALRATKFVEFSRREDGDGNICVSMPYRFCLDSNVKVALPACEQMRNAKGG